MKVNAVQLLRVDELLKPLENFPSVGAVVPLLLQVQPIIEIDEGVRSGQRKIGLSTTC